MARGKKATTGGKVRGSSCGGQRSKGRSPKSSRAHSHDADRDTPAFTLRDAARTEHSGAFWSSNLNLRHRSIGFVRSNEPLGADELKPVPDEDPNVLHIETVASSSPSPPPDILPQRPQIIDIANAPDPPIDPINEVKFLAEASPDRSPSPALSNSSEEVVLFKGRRDTKRVLVQTQTCVTTNVKVTPGKSLARNAALQANAIDEFISRNPAASIHRQSSKRNRSTEVTQLAPSTMNMSNSIPEPWNLPQRTGRDVPRRKDRRKREREMEIEDNVLGDYVDNMRENGEINDVRNTQLLDEAVQNDADDWASSDIRDFDELSTSSEVLDAIQYVLAKRHRPQGLQYLIVWEGYTIDDARWIPYTSLTMDGAVELINLFEEEEKIDLQLTPGSDESDDGENASFSDVDDDDDDDGDEDAGEDEDEDFEDEKDLIERRAARLSDERLARLLAKQEDLGLGSDELVLFDEMFADEGDGEGESDAELRMILTMSRDKRKSKRGRLDFARGFEDVMLDGDDYGDFDIMDRERPGLGQGAKRQGDPMMWGLSDSEQAEDLRRAWATDRKKKKARKQEREELRAQGLLGKKNKFKPDLKARYNNGIDIDQLGRELQEFLFATYDSHALPPMAKHDRKVIHEIASTFGIKSLSRGSGRSRFTTLQKTSKTIPFDEMLFQRVCSNLTRRFFPRMDVKPKAGARATPRRGGGSGTVRADTSYRVGEVVGGTAPEIGSDNRGRAMLEKMGWTSGNALGALDNKGILQPIAHVIRSSRAGLG